MPAMISALRPCGSGSPTSSRACLPIAARRRRCAAPPAARDPERAEPRTSLPCEAARGPGSEEEVVVDRARRAVGALDVLLELLVLCDPLDDRLRGGDLLRHLLRRCLRGHRPSFRLVLTSILALELEIPSFREEATQAGARRARRHSVRLVLGRPQGRRVKARKAAGGRRVAPGAEQPRDAARSRSRSSRATSRSSPWTRSRMLPTTVSGWEPASRARSSASAGKRSSGRPWRKARSRSATPSRPAPGGCRRGT